MPQDAFTIYHTAKELDGHLRNARVDKINQPTDDTVVISVRTANKNEQLLLSANCENARVCVFLGKKDAPLQAPKFCMLLRKHLSRAVITSFEAIPYERIIKITFSTKNEMRESGTKVLYAEIMAKYSNLTLTEEGKILGAIKESQSIEGLRPIFPGVNYQLPPPQGKVVISDETAAIDTIEKFAGGDFADYIFKHFKGISCATATEIVYRYFKSTDPTKEDIKKAKISDFCSFFKNFYESCNCQPNIIFDNNLKDFFITDYSYIGGKKIFFSAISDTIDAFFTKKETLRTYSDRKAKLLNAVKAHEKKLRKKYQIALDKIASCKDMQQNRICGELIISNLYRISAGLKKVELDNYYDESGGKITVQLDPDLSPKDNAARYFKKYAKQKKTLKAVEPQIAEIEAEIKYVDSIYAEIELCVESDDFSGVEEELILQGILRAPKKNAVRKVKSTPYRHYSYGGFDIYVGKNNIANSALVSESRKHDIWLHTKNYHSAHVVIRTEGKQVDEDVIRYAAELCAFYSEAVNSDKVPVDYTMINHVKKPAGAPPGLAYYSEYKTIYVTPKKHTD